MRILLDECLPKRLKRDLIGHDAKSVPEMGWAGKIPVTSHHPPERFHVFVSYTTREEETRVVKPIVDGFLEVLRPAIAEALGEPPVFYDGYGLHYPSEPRFLKLPLEPALRFAIEESEVLVAFVSPEYPGSRWCRFECETMALKKRRPWFDVCRVAPIPELQDRRLPGDRPGRWACARARLMRRFYGNRPRTLGGVIVPVIWKGDTRLLGEMPELAGLELFDWTSCAPALATGAEVHDHLYRHGSVSPSWEGEAQALRAMCETSMRATAAAIVDILKRRRRDYAAPS